MSPTNSITARVMNGVLKVDGFLKPTADIADQTVIAKVDYPINSQTFASAVTDNADNNGGRFILRVNGNIQIERKLLANHWYSFTLVAFTN